MKRIKKFGVYQTAKVSAIIYFLIAVVIVLPIGLLIGISGASESIGFPFLGGFALVFVPVFYALIGFVFTAIACFVYNLVSVWTGGIEVEFEELDSTSTHLIEG